MQSKYIMGDGIDAYIVPSDTALLQSKYIIGDGIDAYIVPSNTDKQKQNRRYCN